MKQAYTTRSGERGVALILSLMILALLTIMAMGALVTAQRSIEISGNSRYNMKAFYTADAGLNRGIADFLDYYENNLGGGGFGTGGVTTGNLHSRLILNLEYLDGTGYNADNADDEAPSIYTRSTSWTTGLKPTLLQWQELNKVFTLDQLYSLEDRCFGDWDGTVCRGLYYDVWYHRVGTKLGVKVLALARYNNDDTNDENDRIDAAIEYYISMNVNDPCNNAIFASGQATGKPIDGNVKIHGGMNLQCDQITDPGTQCADYSTNSDTACSAVDSGGNVAVNNNYESQGSGAPPDFLAKIDSLAEDDNGEKTLSAKVLIENCGIRQLGGNASIGELGPPMDAVVVDGGVGTTYGAVDPAIAADISSAEGIMSGPNAYSDYMGSSNIEFPKIYSDVAAGTASTEPVNATTLTTAGGTSPIVPTQNGGVAIAANSGWCNMTANSTTPLLYRNDGNYNAAVTNCGWVGGVAVTTGCDLYTVPPSGANGLHIVSKTDTVFNFSNCNQNLGDIDGDGTTDYGANLGMHNKEIVYEGKGTFFYGTKDVVVNGDLHTKNNYPSSDAIAFMTGGSMNLGPSSGSELQGLFYAQTSVKIDFQTQIAGIIMTDNFHSSGTAEVYQVPELGKNAPEGFGKICQTNERLATGGWRLVY